MEQQAVLELGTFTLLCCGAGLVFIHTRNPLLKGLNWMGGALIAGGAAAALTLASLYLAAFLPLANLCIVLAFALCYRADQFLIGKETHLSTLSLVLLLLQATVAPLQWLHLVGSRLPTLLLSVLLIIQLETTARYIVQSSSPATSLSARFTAGMMRFLAVGNLLRGGMAATGLLDSPKWGHALETAADNIFIAAAIGLAFCFFWRATARLTEELEHMASTDPLTRVYNRRVFLKWCEKEHLRTLDTGVPFSVLLIDFDHFKKINDTFGHHVGDDVLCAAVERIQDSVRGIDVLCRWGGEEFAVLLPTASLGATRIVAERIRENIRSLGTSMARFGRAVPDNVLLTVSIGAATYDGEEDGVQQMLQRADVALYGAKGAGRDRVFFAPRYTMPSTRADPSLLWQTPLSCEPAAKR